MTNDQTVTQADERAADEWYPDRSATMHRKLAKLLARHRTAHSGEGRDSAEYCRKCGRDNPSWSAPSPLWNAVMRGGSIDGNPIHDDLVCPSCFIGLAMEADIASGWRLIATEVNVPLETVTPSGRAWDDAAFLWDEQHSSHSGEGRSNGAGEWQPIDTAPKDGSDIIAVCATAYNPTAFETWWQDGWTHYSRPDEKWHGGVGKWFPTHWMPKPAFPVLSAPQGEVERLREALERLAKLTPASANAHTAQDLCLTVRAISESALAQPEAGGE